MNDITMWTFKVNNNMVIESLQSITLLAHLAETLNIWTISCCFSIHSSQLTAMLSLVELLNEGNHHIDYIPHCREIIHLVD